ncbi:MAG: hypothetical protein JXQ73_11795, partial [Phycisphaerae bacterium]|nr:hypothetical protein [Phycisphaerae bacterium]
MTPLHRVRTVLRGEMPDHVPFTTYENKIVQGDIERRLRNEGMCVIQRSPSIFRHVHRNATVRRIHYTEKGIDYIRTEVHTPKGDLFSLQRPAEGTTWRETFLFTGPEDYAPLRFMLHDRLALPNYEAFHQAQVLAGEDVMLRAAIDGYSPMQELIINLMGIEQFSIEWSERRDELMRLYDVIKAKRRESYRIAAESPAEMVAYGGNVTAEIIGLERFELYVVPHYDECAEVLHAHGKQLCVHLDGNCHLLAEAIAGSKIDCIEAFTPYESDMTLAQARQAWPDKILWINFPSSVHLADDEVVEATARRILREAAPGERFLVGITENVPSDCWQRTFT